MSSMAWHYQTYGLYLRVNMAIAGLAAVPNDVALLNKPADIDIQLQVPIAEHVPLHMFNLYFTSEETDPATSLPILTIYLHPEIRCYYWCYCDGVQFLIDFETSTILADWPAGETLESVVTYLLNPILGFVLRQKGVISLHASAIALSDTQGSYSGIALVGAAGAGKSTTAAAFARLGYAVLTDDIVALHKYSDSFLIQSGPPRLRLWPTSVQILYGTPDALPLLMEKSDYWTNWNKRYLDVNQSPQGIHYGPVPLAAIYLLSPREDHSAAPYIEPVPASTALVALLPHMYMSSLLDKSHRADEFDYLAEVVKSIPVRQVIPHSDPARLDKLCQVIMDDFRTLLQNSSSPRKA